MAEPTASLTAHLRPFDAGAQVVGAAFFGAEPALAAADGAVLIGEPGAQKRVLAHPEGAILVVARDGDALLTGGDDGQLRASSPTAAARRSPRRRAAGSTR